MGIQGLTKLIADNAPQAIKENQINNYFGRKIAVDASMTLYQFLIAVRPDDTNSFTLTNESGETTSHLVGLFYRTIRMIDNGIKPVFVFDGKPMALKQEEINRRKQKVKEAEQAKEEAKEQGDKEALAKMNKRTVRVTPQHNAEAKRLLKLMGVPVVEAPCEAEAQCSALAQAGKVYGVATEDMDSLTLGAPLLLRHMTYSEARKMPIREIRLDKVLEGLGLTMESFIDLCILLGCDYSDTIKGIGPKRALEQIRKYKSIDEILKHLDKDKYPPPENFPFKEIREYFKAPEVTDPELIDLKWTEPDEEGLIQFLAREKAFSEDRVRKGIEKLKKNRQTSVQGRLTSFFTAKPTAAAAKAAKKEEPSDDDMDVDFGVHKSDDEADEEDAPVEATSKEAPASTKSEPVVKPDPVVSDAKPVKSWSDIFGKKLGGSPSKPAPEPRQKSAPPVAIKPDPVVEVKVESTVENQPESPAKKTAPRRKRIVEDDEDSSDMSASKKAKTE